MPTLLANDLVDEYRLMIFPVVLGKGKRLFAAGSTPTAMHYVETRHTSTGVALQVYRPAGRPTYRSFQPVV